KVPERPFFLVSNHLTYLDVLVLGHECPSRFVGKAELRHWPIVLVGLLGKILGPIGFLGAALATARDRHINIDVVVRFLKPQLRLPVAVAGGIATAAVCFTASYGLLDYLAIDGFHAEREATMGQKVTHIRGELGEQFFVLRKQLGLDVRAIPSVVSGKRWDHPGRMNGRAWNQWIEEGGFRDRYPKEEVDRILAPESALDQPRHPFVVVPGGSPRGMLVPAMDLTYPFGFFIIGLRVLLRVLLLLLGVVKPFQPGGDDEADEADEDEDRSVDDAEPAAEGAG
ncbi:MAG: TRAP transporter small permease subunit, partial [Deltaproteobacteria bacterium]|nr:TRAP transporter small permease subunit [Deltaproteobacteria bacterium]MBW2530375.1 TRAP transporter small permease subunit [Deltaproteobacteria bacterium]